MGLAQRLYLTLMQNAKDHLDVPPPVPQRLSQDPGFAEFDSIHKTKPKAVAEKEKVERAHLLSKLTRSRHMSHAEQHESSGSLPRDFESVTRPKVLDTIDLPCSSHSGQLKAACKSGNSKAVSMVADYCCSEN